MLLLLCTGYALLEAAVRGDHPLGARLREHDHVPLGRAAQLAQPAGELPRLRVHLRVGAPRVVTHLELEHIGDENKYRNIGLNTCVRLNSTGLEARGRDRVSTQI